MEIGKDRFCIVSFLFYVARQKKHFSKIVITFFDLYGKSFRSLYLILFMWPSKMFSSYILFMNLCFSTAQCFLIYGLLRRRWFCFKWLWMVQTCMNKYDCFSVGFWKIIIWRVLFLSLCTKVFKNDIL